MLWLGGHPGSGLGTLGIMAALGLVFLLGGRSETIRGLRDDGRDERFAMIDLTATAIAGGAVILAVLIAGIVEIAEAAAATTSRGWLRSPAWLTCLRSLACGGDHENRDQANCELRRATQSFRGPTTLPPPLQP